MLEFIRQFITMFNTTPYKGGQYWRDKQMRERINKDKIGEMY